MPHDSPIFREVIDLSDVQYHDHADQVLAAVESQIDAWLQEDRIDMDIARSGGMLEITLPSGSKVVINKQPPLQEIWLAARQGGYHFKWSLVKNTARPAWIEGKAGKEFWATLSACVTEQAGQPLVFGHP
jgi:CyaY protein